MPLLREEHRTLVPDSIWEQTSPPPLAWACSGGPTPATKLESTRSKDA
ncbi:hypothetical protein [Myxococcus eversor]|nr:hypothetical protein [Myxococcus eversor]